MERKRIRIVKIKGGLGNQLFQYTFARFLSIKTGDLIKLDTTCCYGSKNGFCRYQLNNFSTCLEEATKEDLKQICLVNHEKASLGTLRYKVVAFIEKTFNKKCYFEKNLQFKDFSCFNKKDYFDGYWQSWNYPYEIKNILEHEIILKNGISDKTSCFINNIKQQESVFVGIRRGDYISKSSSIKKFGVFSNNYYLEAMRIISEKVNDPVFYIFSNDIQWCKDNMDFKDYKVFYREPSDQTSDVEELVAMSHFKHAIVMNSTFHWWGAFLINNPNKIIVAPNEWFADGSRIDIVPNEWIKLNRNGEQV